MNTKAEVAVKKLYMHSDHYAQGVTQDFKRVFKDCKEAADIFSKVLSENNNMKNKIKQLEQKEAPWTNIHDIINDAMEKKDRSVTMYINGNSVSASVYPLEADETHWIYHGNGMAECSNCGSAQNVNEEVSTYCSACGELMHGMKEA